MLLRLSLTRLSVSPMHVNMAHLYRCAILTCIGLTLNLVKLNLSNIRKANQLHFLALDDHIAQLIEFTNLTNYTYVSAIPIYKEVTSRDGHVFILNGSCDITEAQLETFQLFGVHQNADFFIVDASNIYFRYLRQIFNFLFEVLSVIFQLIK